MNTEFVYIRVNTQFMENYSNTDSPYWKFKGGDTYVIGYHLSRSESVMGLRDEIAALLETNNECSQEFITDFSVFMTREDAVRDVEAWEPITDVLRLAGLWMARKEHHAVEYDEEMNALRGPLEKVETWQMMKEGGMKNYHCDRSMGAAA